MRISDWSSDVCSSDLPVILSAGRLWDAAKNVRTLNKVAPRLPWPIAVAGDPRGPDGLICDDAENLHYLGTLNDSDMAGWLGRSEEHTSELQSLMRISYAVFCLNKKKKK